ncbi:unannotated protein [freshwater metagenome]|jgi:uncharacterized protein (TIGR00730 family)|uniref:Unannotated protein n=1 Tax=freshwater metagenome TaxID=449393 RepID=A0A6J6KJJ6_9ZZZZ|nr:TIGR00730 family Rossman fold protein [Actinomycetota bacterium]MSY36670.1 TIGR00730 family Rossman fold protein [Actinomycetota bacterium]MTB03508.1 TIGR00730 family Rossman fold protein [Actinomycetota bacterium]MTB08547.1 TIGR00730 family Rossman fold protein [Actinomycetota bacterium]
MRIAVFCSSSPTIDPKYVDLAYQLGEGIGSASWELVTGGGHISMMGAVSRGARAANGRTVGVIPQALVDIEFADHDNDELHVVETMGERKAMITDISDAFITLPGGAGTLEEFFEIWVGRYLKFHNKPVVILDPFGIYDPLHELVLHLESENFIKPGMRDLISWTTTIEDALAACGQ